MSDPADYPTSIAPAPAQLESLRSSALLVYALYALGLFIAGLPTIAGLVLAYVKRGSAAGTIYESHFNYAISTFWISIVIAIIGAVATLVFIGWLVLGLGGIWYVYRILRGGLRATNRQPAL